MTKDEVKTLMRSSRTEAEWNTNCDKVKAACGGYPEFWFAEIVQSGLMNEVMGPGADEIEITAYGPQS